MTLIDIGQFLSPLHPDKQTDNKMNNSTEDLQIVVIARKRNVSRHIVGSSVGVLVEHHFWGLDGQSLRELESGSLSELASKPAERLLEVVVALSGNVEVGHVLALVEVDHLGLHTALLHIALISDHDNGDVAADAGEIAVPVGEGIIRRTGGDIEHQNGAISVHTTSQQADSIGILVSVTQSSELLLTGGIPAVEGNGTTVGTESQSVNLSTASSYTIKSTRIKTYGRKPSRNLQSRVS